MHNSPETPDLADEVEINIPKCPEPSKKAIGVSATISRMDEFKLGRVFDEIVYHHDYNEMIGEKWLFSLSEIDFPLEYFLGLSQLSWRCFVKVACAR